MKRLLLLISVLLLSACSANKIPEGFEEDTLNSRAEEVVSLLNDSKVDEVYTLFRADVQAMIPLEDLKTIIQSKFDQVGSFKEITQIAITETKDPNTSELYAVVILSCSHDKGKTTYTLSFDKDLLLVGFYIK